MFKNLSFFAFLLILLFCSSCNDTIDNGRWETYPEELDLLAVHAALLPNGNVLTLSYSQPEILHQNKGKAQIWNPRTKRPMEVINFNDWNPFCGGHSFLGNSEFLFAGGHVHGSTLHSSSADRLATFHMNDANEVIVDHAVTRMEHRRWYPSVVTLANGNALIIGGSSPTWFNAWNGNNDDYEYFSMVDNYVLRQRETNREYPESDEGYDYPDGDERESINYGKNLYGLYPLTHVLPADRSEAPYGRLFVLTESFVRTYNPATNLIDIERMDVGGFRTWKTMASSVLLPIDIGPNGEVPTNVRILVIGGGTKEEATSEALKSCLLFSYNIEDRTLEIVQEFDLRIPRIMGDGILMPDGNIVVIGGSRYGISDSNSEKVLRPELIMLDEAGFRERNQLFTAASEFERGYHASAVLTQDGAIFLAGGNDGWNEGGPLKIDDEYVEYKSVETFFPPYIDNISPEDRPVISSSPSFLNRGDQIVVTTRNMDADEQIVLMRHGSRTHSLDTDQRMLRCAAVREVITDEQGEELLQLTAKLPDNPTFYPPGPYSIFILRKGEDEILPQKFIPSEGAFVQVNNLGPIHESPQGAENTTFIAQTVELEITTGDDNLEAGNEAWAEIFDVNNDRVLQIELADIETEIPNGTLSTWTGTFPDNFDINTLKKISIRHTADNPEMINSDDWKVDAIKVIVNGIIAETGAAISTTLVECEGEPVFKLSNDYKTKAFAFGVWGNCQ